MYCEDKAPEERRGLVSSIVEVRTTHRESAQQKEQVKCLTLDQMVVIYLVQICFIRLAYLTPQLKVNNYIASSYAKISASGVSPK